MVVTVAIRGGLLALPSGAILESDAPKVDLLISPFINGHLDLEYSTGLLYCPTALAMLWLWILCRSHTSTITPFLVYILIYNNIAEVPRVIKYEARTGFPVF